MSKKPGPAGFERFVRPRRRSGAGDAYIRIGKRGYSSAYISASAMRLLGGTESSKRFSYFCNWETKEVALVLEQEGRYTVSARGVITGVPLVQLGAKPGEKFIATKLGADGMTGIVIKIGALRRPTE